MRLSVTSNGKVRVSMPSWTPYYSAVSFAKSRNEWINEQLSQHKTSLLVDDAPVGKTRILRFSSSSSDRMTGKISSSHATIYSNLHYSDPTVQQKAKKVIEKALKQEAEQLLPVRLNELSVKHGFEFSEVSIKKFSSRWGSCSSKKAISLNYYLMQLPWEYIDAVLLHELIHTKHMHHGPEFWNHFKAILPEARKIQKEIKQFKPAI